MKDKVVARYQNSCSFKDPKIKILQNLEKFLLEL
jgi:hypothetical protein